PQNSAGAHREVQIDRDGNRSCQMRVRSGITVVIVDDEHIAGVEIKAADMAVRSNQVSGRGAAWKDGALCAAHVGAGKDSIRQCVATEGLERVAAERGVGEIGLAEIRTGQRGAEKVGIDEALAGEIDSIQGVVSEIDAIQIVSLVAGGGIDLRRRETA